jgi:hypothetical protein
LFVTPQQGDLARMTLPDSMDPADAATEMDDSPPAIATASAGNRRPVTESAERFLRAIVQEVTRERLAELHLFTALRQGVYETGVAVVAVWPANMETDAVRHTVYTARYRLVVKGPDRGRWEFECVAEADAPLITVETVVRGVQRRSGDLDDPVRYDLPALVHVLRLEDTPSA